MSISINPIFPVIAAQGAAPDLVLKPGTVIDAEVLKLLSDDLVRIAISGLSIEVFSEIPLQVGQALQLAVSQTPDGIRLAVVGQESGAKAVASANAVTLAPDTIVDVAATPPVGAAPPIDQPSRNELTPLERVAVAAAAETPAARQRVLPGTPVNPTVDAASGAVAPRPVSPAAPEMSATEAAAPPHAAAAPTLAPSSPEIDVQEILLPQARVPVADDTLELGSTIRIVLPETSANAGPRLATTGAAFTLLQEVRPENPLEIGNVSPTTASLKRGGND